MSVSPKPIRVLLVDDHQLLTGALAHVLGHEPDIDVVGVACTVAAAKRLARHPVDVALVDYRLPDGTGADAARAIRARRPATRVVMLTAVADNAAIRDSIRAGTDAYLTMDDAVADVVSALRSVHAGKAVPRRTMTSDRAAGSRARARTRHDVEADGLTPREAEVLRALAEGLSTPEICDQLFIAPNTVRTHVQNIMGKLRVHSKLEAVAFAFRHGLVEPPTLDDVVH